MASSRDFEAENARLTARVAELEAQLAAKPPIDRASLYRMVNGAPWAVLAANLEGVVEYANPAFQRFLTVPAPAFGLPVLDALVPDLRAAYEAPFAAALAGAEHQAELKLRDATGEVREVRLQVLPRGRPRDGVTGVVSSLYDVTETQALDRSVRENEARLTHISAVTPSVNYIFDFESGGPVWATGRADDVYDYSAEELLAGGRALASTLVHPDDQPKVAARLRELASQPDGHVCEFEIRVRRRDGSYRWILDRAVIFERSADGRVLKTLSAAIDIDDRKRAEERRTMLINELNHRVKNTLAAVQSIARQTLNRGRHQAQTIEQTVELFTARLVAMSAAHDVLTRENWEGAGLREIVDGALNPFSAKGEGRIVTSGPDVRLGSRAALALAMALHELATNAVKYGALSGESGTVTLVWQASAQLDLEWRESGGPPVAPPSSTGFGSRLLTQGLAADLAAGAELHFAPEGAVCRITAPLEPAPLLELV